ncbi:hypothetical protein [Streptomyces sp. NPDC020965]|uniref:hypothetical protein n=1 Tax=Streptomyces sp. NPDC020965 TaxID=3365105 RepID=UPI00379E33A0
MTSVNHLETWADGVVAELAAQEALDRSLLSALPGKPSLREETAARMADALRAAALGLNPGGCAVAAGVSERLLLTWQAREPAFAAAMAAAAELARVRTPSTSVRLSPLSLRVVLKAVRDGALHAPAAALVGMSGRAFYRLRRESPELGALVAAARRARPRRADRRKKWQERERGYRLVRVDEASPVREPTGIGHHAVQERGSADDFGEAPDETDEVLGGYDDPRTGGHHTSVLEGGHGRKVAERRNSQPGHGHGHEHGLSARARYRLSF